MVGEPQTVSFKVLLNRKAQGVNALDGLSDWIAR